MRVLFDITHPAQVHFFKNVIARLRGQGARVLVTTRQKDVTLQLLRALGIEHLCLSRMGHGLAGMATELVVRHGRMFRVASRFRPDVMVARMGISIGPTGALLRVPRIVFEDTEHAKLQAMLSLPFATYICTGSGYLKDYGARQVRFRGVPHLAYLAPAVFTPDADALRRHGVDVDRPYILLRTVAWAAAHDRGIQGPSAASVADAVRRLSPFGRVLLSSEKPLPPELRPYASPVPPQYLLDLLAFARLYIGEGGSIAAEAAVLGVPSIFCNRLRVGYLLGLERDYGLAYNRDTLDEGVAVATELLSRPNLREEWQERRLRMLAQSEDVAGFMCRFIADVGGKHRDARRR